MKPNGLRYPLVGGTRRRDFDGTHFKPRKTPENVQTPTSRVHPLLAAMGLMEELGQSIDFFSIAWQFTNMAQMSTHIPIIHMRIFKAKMIGNL